jgi:hypothetical protein
MKLLLNIAFFISFNALAIPTAPHRDIHQRVTSHKALLKYDFEGIIKLSNCSGSLVAFKGSPDTQKAIVMTNAHCLPFAKHDQVYVNYPYLRNFTVFDRSMKLHPLKTEKVLYATMLETDVAFLETDKTYGEIWREYKVRPLIIDDFPAPLGTRLDVVSGYWEEVTSCEAEAIIPELREHHWRWFDAIRYAGDCKTRGGFSGSPVIIQHTRTIMGVHNTGNNGKRDCSNMNPCEWGEQESMPLFRRYAQQVYQVYTCLNKRMEIDTQVPGCLLPK